MHSLPFSWMYGDNKVLGGGGDYFTYKSYSPPGTLALYHYVRDKQPSVEGDPLNLLWSVCYSSYYYPN